jgi:hypothetical protein
MESLNKKSISTQHFHGAIRIARSISTLALLSSKDERKEVDEKVERSERSKELGDDIMSVEKNDGTD